LHPGSGSDRKNWPERGWRSLLEHLVTLPDWEFLLISGEAEEERAERLVSVIPPGRVSWARSLPLAELASRLATCRAFIGHDSGISHLAAAVGLPGLVLWGETNESVWRPRSSRFRILRSPRGLTSIEVHRVIDELNDLLSGSE
jgi:ADP-heptose:LPS heptosyltransferase